jgi:ABC-2 type transport system ATP-binding protein
MICGCSRDGGDVTGRQPDRRGALAGIGSAPAGLPDLTGRENLEFFGRLYGLSGARLRSRIGEVLEIVGLTGRAGDRTDKYSGGMQRRLNIGIGLLHQPRLLLLDEPTVGVDPQSRNAILESIAKLGKQGMAILYTTHYMEEAERLCDRVGIIDAGEIRAEGTQRDLVALIGQQDTVRLSVTGDVSGATADVAAVPGVVRADARDGIIEILVADARRVLPHLITAAEEKADVKGVDVIEPNLESVFLHLTGRALRDAAE